MQRVESTRQKPLKQKRDVETAPLSGDTGFLAARAARERCSTSFLTPSPGPAFSIHERLIIATHSTILPGLTAGRYKRSSTRRRATTSPLPVLFARSSSIERKSFLSTATSRRLDRSSRTRETGNALTYGSKTELQPP